MNYECSICKNEPNSHSFELIDYNDQTYFFYTCPAKAIKYYDCSGILQHYDGYLNQMTENTKWVWIFDAEGFEQKQLMEMAASRYGICFKKLSSIPLRDRGGEENASSHLGWDGLVGSRRGV